MLYSTLDSDIKKSSFSKYNSLSMQLNIFLTFLLPIESWGPWILLAIWMITVPFNSNCQCLRHYNDFDNFMGFLCIWLHSVTPHPEFFFWDRLLSSLACQSTIEEHCSKSWKLFAVAERVTRHHFTYLPSLQRVLTSFMWDHSSRYFAAWID